MNISAKMQDTLVKSTTASFAYFLCLIAFYINIGQDMSAKYFLPLLLPTVAVLSLLQYSVQIPLFCRQNLPNLITGLGWCSAFPLLYTWTYNNAWYMSKISYDFIIGTAIFVFLTALEKLLMQTKKIKAVSIFMSLLNLILLSVPIIQYAYYIMFWHCLSPASLMALYLTNWRESIDFLESNVGFFWLFVIAVVGLLLFLLACRLHCFLGLRMLRRRTKTSHTASLAALLLGMIYIVPFWHLPEASIVGLWNDVSDYVAQTQKYGSRHEERFSTLDIDPAQALPALTENPGTVLVIIGESASRDYMKAFSPGFSFDDTPWLSKRAENDPNFLLFQNSYAAFSQTVPTLQRALTEQSQYNDKDFIDSCSIIDAAKKAGYQTWWFSNQGRYGQYDSVITLVAKNADHSEWTDDAYNISDKYDGVLLDYLKKVDPQANNFIVLHIMGSHIYYNNRYPKEFEKWKTADGTGMATAADSYANSILYTDYVLSQIYDYAVENLNLQAMLYFSDHGENLVISHNPDVFSFDMVRIPMFLYLSPEYQSLLPQKADTLRAHASRYFSNDMIYDTVCGILNAPSHRYHESQDLSSEAYIFNKNSILTMLGKHHATEDPNGAEELLSE